MTTTFAPQISAYPFFQPTLLPLSQTHTNWGFNPTLRDSVTWTNHFMKWRHDIQSQSWLLPPPSHPNFASRLGPLPPMCLPEFIRMSQRQSLTAHVTYRGLDPASSSGSCSSVSIQTPPSAQFIEVVCDVPLVVPKPRPFRRISPIDFELPSEDQDLSHPPYTTRSSSKRKRSQDDETVSNRAKRRSESQSFTTVTPSKMIHPRFRNVPSKPR
jgi:hypothetical protein